MTCAHCSEPRDEPNTMHPWCYRAANGWAPGSADVEMVACGPQCAHAPGADHGVYLYSSSSKTITARMNGHYPKNSTETGIHAEWDAV